MTKATRTTVTVSPAFDASAIAAGIVAALADKDNVTGKLSGHYRVTAAYLDTLDQNWSALSFRNIKDATGLAEAAAKADVSPTAAVEIARIRGVLMDALKDRAATDRAAVWQGVCKWSIGYTGSRPLHPEAKARAEATAKANAEEDKAVKGGEGGGAAKNADLPLTEMVTKNPQFARVILSHVHAGLSANRALRMANKVSVATLDKLIEAIEEAAELASAI